ncbi:hypothetical protein MUP07_00740 [Candidatus Bathyarchaeota archaeon]|nr:hypothetical protein [Candidatus Bathyarchaeota archaeon]
MIVTLDDSGWPAKQFRRIRGQVVTTLCSHNPIDHMLGNPCIQIHGFSAKDKETARKLSRSKGAPIVTHLYPLVHQRNILPILNHESVHCVVQNIDEADGLDALIDLIGNSRRILEAA